MARSPLSALADILTLVGEGLDALFVLSLDVMRPSGRHANAVDEPGNGLVLVSRHGVRAMTPAPSGATNPSLGVAGGGAQGSSVWVSQSLGGGTS